jgi:hypothetical protein
MPRIRPRAIVYTILVGICFLAGCFLSDWIRGARMRPIEVVCSHVDYLYEHADEITSSQQWRRELSQLQAAGPSSTNQPVTRTK